MGQIISGKKLSLRQLNLRTTKADWFLFLSLLFLCICGIFLVRELIPDGNTVRIDVDGNHSYVYPLNTDRQIPVTGPLGTTHVEIRDNRVRIFESPCTTKRCVRQGWHVKGSVICLPNRVTVTVGGHEYTTDMDVDATSG